MQARIGEVLLAVGLRHAAIPSPWIGLHMRFASVSPERLGWLARLLEGLA
jgi:hypothetical protein